MTLHNKLMNPFIEEIISYLKSATGLSPEEIEQAIEIPPNPKMGDFSFPCFSLAKRIKKSPQELAAELAGKITPKGSIHSVKAAGPYLNFFVKRPALFKFILESISKEGNSYGHSKKGAGKTIVIDYSSPNIAKHLGVHHLRSAVIGNSLCRIYKAIGYNCVGINHLGDWGTQFGQLIVAWKKWGNEQALMEDPITELYALYVRFHKEAEENPALEDEAREWFKKLEAGDKEARALWQHFKDLSLQEFEKIYSALDIKFDYFTGESFYNEMLGDTVERIRSKGLAEMSQEALIVNLDKYNMPPCLLKKRDETSLYATRDICAAEYRQRQFNFSKMLYVVGSEQKLHFRQLFKVLELMGYLWVKECVHVDFGLIKFKDGKMSTRAGKIILLEEVLKEAVERASKIIEEKNPTLENKDEVARHVGIGAVIFTDLSTKRQKDVNFDWDEVLNFDGETGPYVQYTHARLSSILKKYGRPVEANIDWELLQEEDAFAVLRDLELFPKTIEKAAEDYEPSYISTHLLKLCSTFNRYYQHHRVISQDEPLTRARILLVSGIKQVIKNGLELLGIKAPEKM